MIKIFGLWLSTFQDIEPLFLREYHNILVPRHSFMAISSHLAKFKYTPDSLENLQIKSIATDI